MASWPAAGLKVAQEAVAGVPAGHAETARETIAFKLFKSSVSCTDPVGVPPVVEVTTTRKVKEAALVALLTGVAVAVVTLVVNDLTMINSALTKSAAGKS